MTGIQAIILNNAKIGKNCLVGAGALATEVKEFPDGSLIIGSPAKVVRELTQEQIVGLAENAAIYVKYAVSYLENLEAV